MFELTLENINIVLQWGAAILAVVFFIVFIYCLICIIKIYENNKGIL